MSSKHKEGTGVHQLPCASTTTKMAFGVCTRNARAASLAVAPVVRMLFS
jgi:hypothetical protein